MRLFSSRKLIDPRAHQRPLPLPSGHDKQSILDSLVSASIGGSAAGELQGYATADCERFLHTLALVDEKAGGRMLEIGANPYFITLLMKRFRPGVELSLINYFGPGPLENSQEVVFKDFDGGTGRFDFDYLNLNLETEDLPFPEAHFDHILFCEVLEHLTNHPLHAVLQLKKVLKPDGMLVLTTPNAARLENVVAFIEGRNIYDPYSAYGPYGRHNREYTRHELHQLMEHAGFVAEVSYTANVHDDVGAHTATAAAINAALKEQPNRNADLGQYLMTRWRNAGPANNKLPRWLYRSYPEEDMAQP